MIRKSLSELREEMRGVARGERHASPLPAAPLLAILTPEAMELLGVLLRERPSSISELVARTGRAHRIFLALCSYLHGITSCDWCAKVVKFVPSQSRGKCE